MGQDTSVKATWDNMIRGFLDKDEPTGGAIPTRDQVPTEDTWNLTLLYAAPADWNADFADLQGRYEAVVQFRGRVGESAQTLLAALEFDKSLSLQIERLYHYASLKTSEDSSDAANLARESQMQNLLTRIGEACSFLTPELQAIDDATFARYLADSVLGEWVISLRKIRRLKPHTLSAAEERLLALSASALRGHDETYSQLSNVDMKFGTIVDEKGEEHPLSLSSVFSYLQKRDRGVRLRAFQKLYGEFDDHKFTCASTLANSVKADVFHARARNYPSALEAALFHDDVPVAVYDNLIAAVRASLQPLFRYYQLRKRVLQLDEIHHYDTYVPIVAEIETNIPWDEAVRKVIAALEPLGEEYCRTLTDGLGNGRWCDRYENKGKRSGAFSSSSYRNPPYILMNYKADVFSDVYTLAHEAGHSMHTWYSQRAQRYQEYNYPIFLAEVASTFNEELLTHRLLAETQDPKMRAYLINRQLDDIRGTVYRQTMFAEFEKLIHAMEESGEPLTLDTFRQTYRGLLDAYFGPDFVIDAELELECFRIPHFYSAFYVYKYATGISAAIALSQQVIESGNAQRYLGFLESGSSRFPIPTLRDAGVDMSSPAPIEATLQLFARRVEELERLLS
ncbi:MAG TPA: oligoendopeptidase F [Chthoniobacteraceae bacterium]|nr:oligoendopeptidase F [Chthoniobacteraceae bacterium]